MVGKLASTQVIIMPKASHGPQHKYPDLAAKYISAFVESSD
ncbi:MAG TPA: hypothetical protein VFJ51_09650 [Nitrososphaeraceae archaeon]|nr:hypothetical protein [Nitrososphaeraceae archaeon]